jgi:hypothetical protein
MKFFTNRTFELGLAGIDEAIIRAARRQWRTPLRTKHNPDWVSRGARSEKHGAGMCRIILKGRFRLRYAQRERECEGEFTADVVRLKKRRYAHRVTGFFISDGETIQVDEEL